ncbi:hypothetical protein [Halomarina oriensis]|uniref:Uncharacterized protein n=1 Tax=Halomarina oriensis TaxID=671145 RepID=A0A6B0GGU3_9EURY|nr:hypothetical protein [Halomarina oriensis]MWG32961.1 hypothetical protein [Halomarina oriensis]
MLARVNELPLRMGLYPQSDADVRALERLRETLDHPSEWTTDADRLGVPADVVDDIPGLVVPLRFDWTGFVDGVAS